MKNTKTNPTKTVLIITIGFLLVYLVSKWHWAIYVSLVIGLAGAFSDYLSKKIDFLWMKLAWVLNLIVPNILLGIIFYIFLVPISLLSKLFSKSDPLTLKNKTGSIFKTSNKSFDKASFEKTW